MKKRSFSFFRNRKWLIAGLWCLGLKMMFGEAPPVRAAEEASGDQEADEVSSAAESEEVEEFSNWLGGSFDYSGWFDVSVGGTIVDGSEAEFQRRLGMKSGAFGGVNEFHWEKFVGSNGLWSIDGRLVPGNEDYFVEMKYSDTEKGYIRGGFKQYRTWYNGAGGFYPPTDAWFPLDDQELHLDRGEFWLEGQLTLEDWPVLKVRYSHEYRDGQKDSTIWGATAAADRRGIAASFRGIDERRDIVTLDLTDTYGKTDVGLGLRVEHNELDNSLNLRQEAGTVNEYFVTQHDDSTIDLFNLHASTQTRFNEKVTFTSGYSFTTLDTDISGSRIYGDGYDPVYDPSVVRGPGFIDLSGGSRIDQHVLALNLMYLPVQHVSIVPSFRVESRGVNGDSLIQETPGAGSFQSTSSDQDYVDFSERLEVRYTGLPDWVFYARGDWLQGDGDLQERQTALTTGAVELQRDTDFTRLTQKYTAGANWYPLRKLNFSTQYYFKTRDNDYTHDLDSTDNTGAPRYPAYLASQNFDTHDVNVRATWRPVNGLISVSRYDYQMSTVDTTADGLSEIESADIHSHIFSQSLTWSPLNRLYLQGTFSYTIDATSTPANEAPTAPNLVLESENDYWNVGFAAGYALDHKTDLEAEYLYYRADNFVDNSSVSQPFGAGFKEHRVLVTLVRRINENLRWLLRYGYFTNDDETYGGLNDYDAHLVYSSVQYRF